MKHLSRIRRRILAVVPAVLLVSAVFGVPGSAAAGAEQGEPASSSDRDRLVGTYRLITAEVRTTPGGEWSPVPDYRSVGYITYAETGHMGVHVMPRHRAPFASNPPTGEEARAALRGYAAYFGSFSVDAQEQFVIHHRVGQIDPGGEVDAKRFYDFDGDRLLLTPAPADGGGKETAMRRIVWERLPDAPLSAEARRFVGFYQLLYTDRYRERDGALVFHGDENRARAGTSYIIYTPTGHMMVHLMQNEGRTPYAGPEPTPEEALQAYRSYGGYFGRFTTYEQYDPPFVMHNQQGTLRPGGDVDATKRFYQLSGNILRLGGPPGVNDEGELAGGQLYWERLPPTAGER